MLEKLGISREKQPWHGLIIEHRRCVLTHWPPLGRRPTATRLLVANPDYGGSPGKAVLAAHLSPPAVGSLDATDPSCLRPSPTAGRAGGPLLSTPPGGVEE